MTAARRRCPFAGTAASLGAILSVAAASACGGGERFLADEAAYRANNQGVALLEQFDYTAAAAAFRQALAHDASYAAARINLAIALFLDQDLEAAADQAAAAASALPAALEPPYLDGLIARAQNRPEDAERAFRAVLDADPDDVGANINLGQIHLEARDYAAAIERLRAAYAREPFNVTAVYSLGLALARSGSSEEGQALLAESQALRATGYAVTYGTGYLQQGRYAEAIVSTGAEPELVDPALPPAAFTVASVARRDGVETAPSPFGRRFAAVDLTAAGERALAASLGGGVTLIDFDQDGDLDLFAAFPDGQQLLRNDGSEVWTAITATAGLADAPAGSVPVGALAADFDNDHAPDLFVLRYGRSSLYRNDGRGRFTDVAEGAGLATATEAHLPGAAAFTDVDHDGDVDLVIAGLADLRSSLAEMEADAALLFPGEFAPAPLSLWRNNLDGSFTDVTEPAGVTSMGHAAAIVASDFDNRRDVDLLVVDHEGPPRLFMNQRDSTFQEVAAAVGLAEASGGAAAVAAGDVNKDDFPDFVFGWQDGVVLALSDRRGRFRVEAGPPGAAPGGALQLLDYDNDGVLDLLAWGPAGPQLYRNLGGAWSDVTATAFSGLGDLLPPVAARALVVADVDNDGDHDLVAATAANVAVYPNSGAPANGSLRVALRGYASNRGGVGAKVQLRAGSLQSRAETAAATPAVAPADVVFGLGRRPGADVARVLWPSGILQAEVPVTEAAPGDGTPTYLPAVLAIEELDREPSSCPFLFAWNGTRFEFITDFLGGGEMGYWHGPQLYNTPDPVEYVRIRGDQLQPRDGVLEMRITNELEEALFLDRVELVVLDHPRAVAVYPNEGMTAPPKPHRLHVVRDIRPLAGAVDDRGADVSAQLAQLDRRYPEGFPLFPFRGYADTHALTLDLGPTGGGAVLLLTGWTSYAFSSDNVAAYQAGLGPQVPVLEIQGTDDAWRPSDVDLGIPVGRPQTIALDLTDQLRPGEHVVRILTNMRIYWDRIEVAQRGSFAGVRERRLDPMSAELRQRGFSAELHPGGTQPTTYDYDRVTTVSPWKTMVGRYTREGEVTALLTATDDQFVIMRDGDETALRFDAAAIASPAEGHIRTYLLRADGYSKEMNIHSATPDAVAPLPFHAMSQYPYDAPESYPDTADHRRYRETYNTRTVVASVPRIETAR